MKRGVGKDIGLFTKPFALLQNKKAQLTAIITLGVVLLLVFAFIFFISQSEEGPLAAFTEKENADTAAVRAFVQTCIKNEVANAAATMGGQAGLLFADVDHIILDDIPIPIAYKNAENLLPSKQLMSEQLALYLNQAVLDCTDYSDFETRGFTIETEELQTTATISDFKIVVDVTYPVTVTKAGNTQRIDDFLEETNSPLGDMHRVSNLIIQKIVVDPLYIDMLYLASFDYNITYFPFNETVTVYTLKQKVANPLFFQFATEHELQQPPFFNAPDSFTLKDGEPFLHDFQATDPNGGQEGIDLIFEDNVGAFDILDDGKLLFVPEITGAFNATISLTDPTGLRYAKQIQFEVIE